MDKRTSMAQLRLWVGGDLQGYGGQLARSLTVCISPRHEPKESMII